MFNFKPGMRVVHYRAMNRPGTILKVVAVKSKQWMIGGTSQERLVATVQLDIGETVDYYVSDLRIEE
tara:strand:+ start:95 stop:295 length:201 start_codon:yes stop_codon:yes gene_type:complete